MADARRLLAWWTAHPQPGVAFRLPLVTGQLTRSRLTPDRLPPATTRDILTPDF
jgi:hypothetical protein